MLEQIFLEIVNMGRAASMIIIIVMLVRSLLKRFPKYISYMLWSVVLFRLLCPFTFESEISLVPNPNPVFYEYISEKSGISPYLPDDIVIMNPGDEIKNKLETGQTQSIQSDMGENVQIKNCSWQELFILFGKYVWISGTGLMFLNFLLSFVKIRKKVSESIPLKENIYITDETVSPFVMGIFNPKIYLPVGLCEKEQEYIILHEQFHIRRFDYLVKPVAYVALCLHWFNPLVWIAFNFFCKDMEMSCDEAVITKMGETIRADYSESLLALSTRRRIISGLPVDFGEGDTKGRVKNLAAFRKTNKGVAAILIVALAVLIVCLASNSKTSISGANEHPDETDVARENTKRVNISLNIADYYITSTGDPSNLYYIDENNVLWGSGRNEYGQLGQGTQDYDFHREMLKISENVVHVDYSQKGFVVFLTEDHKLYGMGNAGCGALQQYEEFDWTRYTNGEHYTVTMPILLMEDVIYACCGRADIVCMKADGTVWTWGTTYVEGNILSNNVHFIKAPKKVLENAALVTGGWFNHAALLRDGTVWTWGYNSAGNCGVADVSVVSEPTMVANDVVMVWTNIAVTGDTLSDEDAVMVWTKNSKYHTEYDNIADFGDSYPRCLNNTVIQKEDGSYWVCGENVGETERIVHGTEGDYSVICTHEFYLCQ